MNLKGERHHVSCPLISIASLAPASAVQYGLECLRRGALLILQSPSVPPRPSVVSEWDKKDERSGRGGGRGTYPPVQWVYFSHVCQHGGRAAALCRHFAEVVVIRDGPLFIRPLSLLPSLSVASMFHPSPTEREANGEEIDPLFRVSHSNATYVREAPVS